MANLLMMMRRRKAKVLPSDKLEANLMRRKKVKVLLNDNFETMKVQEAAKRRAIVVAGP